MVRPLVVTLIPNKVKLPFSAKCSSVSLPLTMASPGPAASPSVALIALSTEQPSCTAVETCTVPVVILKLPSKAL